MSVVRLGAVSYLNARPLAEGLEQDPGFAIRYDVPSRCADLLHEHQIDLGLIPSIEYLRAPAGTRYAIVPDLAIASNGPVASVAIYTTKPIGDVRSIALDTSSRTSVALVRVLCGRVFGIAPAFEHHGPSLTSMLSIADAALLIGDNALFEDGTSQRVAGMSGSTQGPAVEKIDLGRVWTDATGLPFVWAVWAGREGCVAPEGVRAMQGARDRGISRPEELAAAYFAADRARQAVGARYLRDNIKYSLGTQEQAGLERFYRYAAELGVVANAEPLRFFAS